mmetsp:Transcript_17346/g.32373  ORF Transcript_17346/g.32373 Transcript_17346/m.32373 type:complete len:285 (+) Transcript_17346:195-1049(+)|eukprot:scaffold10917_cov155-Amphora_coffeaeformis.AAC.7
MKFTTGFFATFALAGISSTFAGDIQVCVTKLEGGVYAALPNAYVQCWDEDYDLDDVMTDSLPTGPDGCVDLTYTTLTSFWSGWDYGSNPDIYCLITKDGVIYPSTTTTLNNWDQNKKATFSQTVYPHRTCSDSNGCGPSYFTDGVSDTIDAITGFAAQCNIHDCCYSDCDETKESCDFEFLGLLYSKCNDSWDDDVGKATCYAVAEAMFASVVALGDSAFDASRGACGDTAETTVVATTTEATITTAATTTTTTTVDACAAISKRNVCGKTSGCDWVNNACVGV